MSCRMFAIAVAVAGIAQSTHAELITTASGAGQDVGLQRGSIALSDDALLRVKNQSGVLENSTNDRVALLKFDLSLLVQPINLATIRLETPRGVATSQPLNTFDAGETLFLYGIPDLAAGETTNLTTVTWANSPYLTGTSSATNPRDVLDLTGNNVNDLTATLVGSFIWPVQSDAGNIVDFFGPALNAFLQADSNDVATFILTVSQSNATKTPVFGSSTAVAGGPAVGLKPTLLTNGNAVPEPMTLGMAVVAVAGMVLARRRRA
jgi:hypothetical protein